MDKNSEEYKKRLEQNRKYKHDVYAAMTDDEKKAFNHERYVKYEDAYKRRERKNRKPYTKEQLKVRCEKMKMKNKMKSVERLLDIVLNDDFTNID